MAMRAPRADGDSAAVQRVTCPRGCRHGDARSRIDLNERVDARDARDRRARAVRARRRALARAPARRAPRGGGRLAHAAHVRRRDRRGRAVGPRDRRARLLLGAREAHRARAGPPPPDHAHAHGGGARARPARAGHAGGARRARGRAGVDGRAARRDVRRPAGALEPARERAAGARPRARGARDGAQGARGLGARARDRAARAPPGRVEPRGERERESARAPCSLPPSAEHVPSL